MFPDSSQDPVFQVVCAWLEEVTFPTLLNSSLFSYQGYLRGNFLLKNLLHTLIN